MRAGTDRCGSLSRGANAGYLQKASGEGLSADGKVTWTKRGSKCWQRVGQCNPGVRNGKGKGPGAETSLEGPGTRGRRVSGSKMRAEE